jgi:hypothetical protein
MAASNKPNDQVPSARPDNPGDIPARRPALLDRHGGREGFAP